MCVCMYVRNYVCVCMYVMHVCMHVYRYVCICVYVCIYIMYACDNGGTVVKVLCYKSEGRWFDPSWCHWNFSLT